MKGRQPVCTCEACSKCSARAKRRRHYERHGAEVRAAQYARNAEKRYTTGQPLQSAEYKSLAKYRASMRKGKAPTKGRYRLHDAHVRAFFVFSSKEREKQQRWASTLHDAHVVRWRRSCPGAAFTHRYRTDPAFNLAQRLRAHLRKVRALDGQMAACLAVDVKRGALRANWNAMLGYGIPQLRARLESSLPPGATWDDFMTGRLHIDHIRPRASFDLTDLDEVRACWQLSNLQLLWAADNMRKGARWEATA